MPELPEVETVRRGLSPFVVGRRLLRVEFTRDDLRWPIPVRRVRALCGRTCTGVARRSKYLLLAFDGAPRRAALVHLGMTGRLFVTEGDAGPLRPHEHWRMHFDGVIARYVDPRRFGALDVVDLDAAGAHPLLAALGPEPLEDGFTAEYLFEHTRGRKVATKTLLMDAKVVVGVGNIYASESCFRAGVRPSRAAGRLSRGDCERLVAAIRAVLGSAIAAGGTTLRDYVGATEGSGFFQQELFVYDRAGEACRVCGSPIRKSVTGQRSTYWCAHCQR